MICLIYCNPLIPRRQTQSPQPAGLSAEVPSCLPALAKGDNATTISAELSGLGVSSDHPAAGAVVLDVPPSLVGEQLGNDYLLDLDDLAKSSNLKIWRPGTDTLGDLSNFLNGDQDLDSFLTSTLNSL